MHICYNFPCTRNVGRRYHSYIENGGESIQSLQYKYIQESEFVVVGIQTTEPSVSSEHVYKPLRLTLEFESDIALNKKTIQPDVTYCMVFRLTDNQLTSSPPCLVEG